MAPTKTRGEEFLMCLTEPARAAFAGLPLAELEALLEQGFHTARAAWPTIDLAAQLFFPYVAKRTIYHHKFVLIDKIINQ